MTKPRIQDEYTHLTAVQAYYARKRKKGLCLNCNLPPEPDHVRCRGCLDKGKKQSV